MKTIKYLIVILIQLNLIFLILNIYSNNNSSTYLCYEIDEYNNNSASYKIKLDDNNFIEEYIKYFPRYNRNNFKETLSYSTKFYKQDKKVINNRIYLSNNNNFGEKDTIFQITAKFPNSRCILVK
jgi:ABC-type dipeptide/oligopeptide/nickel transport system permease component